MRVIRHAMQPYEEAVAEQERLVDAVLAGRKQAPILILTEHPHVYTIGTSGRPEQVLAREVAGVRVPVVKTGRGGEVTYHGPGQLVVYVIADLRKKRDLKAHVHRLEELGIRVLARLGVRAGRSARGIGVWVDGKKIAAIGVRCRRWVTYHGMALNIAPDLRFFAGIVPCGMEDRPVTSLAALGVDADRATVEPLVVEEARGLFDV